MVARNQVNVRGGPRLSGIRLNRLGAIIVASLVMGGITAVAQSGPPVGYFRSYVSDLPERPLISVTVTGAVGVACFSIEESLPMGTIPEAINAGGQYVPESQAIRWGPFTNQSSANVSYRLTGAPGTYPITGGAWADGQWYFQPPITQIPIADAAAAEPAPPPQVATPAFAPLGGPVIPTNVTISCATTGAQIRFTMDGSLPGTNSALYTSPIALTQAVVLRARAFTNGFLPSPAAVQSYGVPASNANLAVSRVVNFSPSNAPVIQFAVTPVKGSSFTLEERLPVGLMASNISAGGVFLPQEAVVRWGPFGQTNSQVLSYQLTGPNGSYPLKASWSVNGHAGGEAVGTNVFVAPSPSDAPPTPLPQVATPAFSPPSGADLPVLFSLACATPGAQIHYTLDGSLPTTNSLLYTAPVFVNSNVTVRARAFTNGWMASAAGAASYGRFTNLVDAVVVRNVDTSTPTNPLVTLAVTAGSNAACLAVTESLPMGLIPADITAGGNFLAGSNAIVWGPFFGSNIPPLAYRATGRSGSYQTLASWSVDGSSTNGGMSTVSIPPGAADGIPTLPPQVPAPVITPNSASNLPVMVAISSPDPAATIHFTLDGSLPSTNSMVYTAAIPVAVPTTIRARAFRAGYTASPASSGNFWPPATTNNLVLSRSVVGNNTFFPTASIAATPTAGVGCYSVTETFPPGLVPVDVIPDAEWDPEHRVLRWGPFLDNQPRSFSYGVLADWSGQFAVLGEGSFDGVTVGMGGAQAIAVNLQYSGMPDTSTTNCLTDVLTYNLNFQPATNVLVTNVVGYLDWGDGTQSLVTNKTMTLQKVYAVPGTYQAVLSVNWKGLMLIKPPFLSPILIPYSGPATQTNVLTAVAQCLPVIVTQPQPTNQSAWAGANVQISMTASSAFPLTYQWYWNGTNPIVSPSTFNVLSLANVRPEASGLYSVVVTNFYGSVTSQTARLLVAEPQASGIARNPNGSFTLTFSGLPNVSTRTWAATNLVPPVLWLPISTNNSGTAGVWQVTDVRATNFPIRFYRFSAP